MEQDFQQLKTVLEATEEEAKKKGLYWWLTSLSGKVWFAIVAILLPIFLGLALYWEPSVLFDTYRSLFSQVGISSETQLATALQQSGEPAPENTENQNTESETPPTVTNDTNEGDNTTASEGSDSSTANNSSTNSNGSTSSTSSPTSTSGTRTPQDIDGDGIPNELDPDMDGDGIPNATDPDIDSDGIPNELDNDDDGDGVGDVVDTSPSGVGGGGQSTSQTPSTTGAGGTSGTSGGSSNFGGLSSFGSGGGGIGGSSAPVTEPKKTETSEPPPDTTPPTLKVYVSKTPSDPCIFGGEDGVPTTQGGDGTGACSGKPSADTPYVVKWDVGIDTKRMTISVDGGETVATTDTSHSITIPTTGVTSSLVITVSDALIGGNEASVSYSINVFDSWPLIISEVAWAGTKADSDAQWIEIYNPSNVTVDLSTFRLVSGATESTPVLLSGTLAPKSYILVQNTGHLAFESGSVQGLTVTENIGQLFAGGPTTLALMYGPDLIDTTPTPVEGRWPGGAASIEGSVPRTMERSALSQSTDPSSDTARAQWGTNLGLSEILHVGRDSDGNEIAGTPGVQNSLIYLLWASDEAPANTQITLTADHGVYYVPNIVSYNTFANGVKVTAEPGAVVIVAPGASLTVTDGELRFNGQAVGPVTMTSVSDAIANDLLNANAVTIPSSPTDGWDVWGALIAAEDGVIEIARSHLRNGGKEKMGMIEMRKGAVTVIDESAASCTRPNTLSDAKTSLVGSASAGIYAFEGELTVKCIYIGDYTTYGIVTNPSLVTPPSIAGDEYTAFKSSLTTLVTNSTFAGSSTRGSKGAAVVGAHFGQKDYTWSGNNGSGNTINGILLGSREDGVEPVVVYGQQPNESETEVEDDAAIQIFANEIPYVLNDVPLSIGLPTDAGQGLRSKLLVNTDVVFKARGTNARVDVYGTLITRGVETSLVAFTSLADDLSGRGFLYTGATISGATPAAEDWAGIILYPHTMQSSAGNALFSGTFIGYAGKAHASSIQVPAGVRAGIIALDKTTITFERGSVVSSNGLFGVYANNSHALTLTDVYFENHVYGDGAAGIKFVSAQDNPDTSVTGLSVVSNATCKNNGVGNPPHRDVVFVLADIPSGFTALQSSSGVVDSAPDWHYCEMTGLSSGSSNGGPVEGESDVISFEIPGEGTVGGTSPSDRGVVVWAGALEDPDVNSAYDWEGNYTDGNLRVMVTRTAAGDPPVVSAPSGSVALTASAPVFASDFKTYVTTAEGSLIEQSTYVSSISSALDSAGYSVFKVSPTNPDDVFPIIATFGAVTKNINIGPLPIIEL